MTNTVPKKVAERIKTSIKKYQKILEAAKSRDVNESDTAVIVGDILADVMGFDKYSEITTEFAIKNTYCDLAIKTADGVQYLIEVKAIGLDLRENHLRQALDYAANHGVDWVVLTNGVKWEAYRVIFTKPMKHEKVFGIDLLDYTPRDEDTTYQIYLISKEGLKKSAIEDFHKKSKIVNKFTIAAILQTEPVVNIVAREIRKLGKSIKVDKSEIKEGS